MSANPESNIHLLWFSTSFAEDDRLYKQIKKVCPHAVVVYYDIPHISFDTRQSLSNYVLVNSPSEAQKLYEYVLSSKICEIKKLGSVKDHKMFRFVSGIREASQQEITIGAVYQITEGEYRNLIVKAFGVDEKGKVIVRFPILGKVRELHVDISRLTRYKELSRLKRKGSFKNLIMKDKAFVIDGHNILYRAIYSYPDKYSALSNRYIGGGYGFYFSLLKIKTMYPEYGIYVCFDSDIGDKQKYYPEYKKQRPPKTERFRQAFEDNLRWCTDLCISLGIPVYRIDGIEGDDLVGSTVKRLLDYGYNDVVIYSQDGDFNQLLSDKVRIFQPKNTFKQSDRMYDSSIALKEYGVNRVDKILWYKALHGDTSDNILSINKRYQALNLEMPLVKDTEYIPYINGSDTFEALSLSLSKDPRFEPFIKEGYLQKNLNILKIDTSYFDDKPFVLYDPERLDRKSYVELLREFAMYRELEFIDRNLNVFKGVW